MSDKVSIRKRVYDLVLSAAKKLDLEGLAKLAMDCVDIKAKMEGSATAMKEHMAQALKGNKALQEFIADDKAVQAVMKARNYDPASVYAVLESLEGKLKKAFESTKEQEKQIGQLKMRKVEETEGREDVIADAKERLEAAKAELEAAKEALKEAESKAKDATKMVTKTNLGALYEDLKKAAKAAAGDELEKQDQQKKKDEDKKKQDKFLQDVKERSKPSDKPAAPAPKSSLNTTAAKDLDQALADVQDAEAQVQEAASGLAENIDMAESKLASGLSMAMEAADMAEGAASEEAPAEESEESDAEEGGWLDMLMPAPGPAMEMAPAAASAENPWIVTSDLKSFPSDFDQSGNKIELAEGDEGNQIVIRKDPKDAVKSRVTRRVEELYKGAFRADQKVSIDLGERIVEASIVKYAGNRRYEVAYEGKTTEVPVECIFVARPEIWR